MPKLEVSRAMIGTFILGLVAIMLLSAGQTSMKAGLNAIGGVSLAAGPLGFLKLFQTPWVIVGFICYGVSSILWLDVLSKLDFSLAFPMVGLTYVFTLLIGRFFFGEAVGWERTLGVALILCGVFFLIRSGTPR
ncbi:MAG: EamA family transporter [Anaerolineae bacterium]|nr:EamA family transporter [Anaerolineae bacterium]